MANLVSPGYKKSTLINQVLAPYEERLIEFKGLNRNTYVEEGEMSDMKNLTSDHYPLLTPRKLRGQLALPDNVAAPFKLITKFERIAMIARKTDNSIAFFYSEYNENGVLEFYEVTSVNDITASTEMVSINTKICFFPQKTYISLKRTASAVEVDSEVGYGHLEASLSLTSAAVTISNENAQITVTSGHGLKADDAIDINGTLAYTPSGGSATTAACVVSCLIEAVNGNVLTLPRESFIELTGDGATGITFTGTIKREAPDIDHVVEWNNRLWGASDNDNTIYACKLGDPTNWKYYQGTSLDSYYAQQGTDENFTGSAVYSGHLIFFKPNSMTRIYGTSPSTFQVSNTVCYGVEKGSSKSVVVINDNVLYKSSIGIMTYDGGTPYCISDKLNVKFKNVIGGTEGRKYYVSLQRDDDTYELMVLDVERAVWHKEDTVRFRDCCTLDGSLYFIPNITAGIFERNKIYIINPKVPTELRKQREWMAVFGAFDEYVENQKIYSKMSLRLVVKTDTIVTIYIKMDDGEWERIKQIGYANTGGETVPIVPRRCDRFYIKIVGKGDCEIKSLTRRYRRGSVVSHDS